MMWTPRWTLLAGLAGLGPFLGACGAVETHRLILDIPVEVTSDSDAGDPFDVVLYWLEEECVCWISRALSRGIDRPVGRPGDEYVPASCAWECHFVPQVLDHASLPSPGTVSLQGELEFVNDFYDPHLRVGVWQEVYGGTWFDGADLEPCDMVELGEPYTRTEPLRLEPQLFGCFPTSDSSSFLPGWPDPDLDDW